MSCFETPMNKAGSEVSEEKARECISNELTEVLIILNYYMKKIEEERGDPKRLMLTEDSLKVRKTLKYLTDQQYISAKEFLLECITTHKILKMEKTIRSEIYLHLGFALEKGLFGMKKNPKAAFDNYMLSTLLKNSIATFKVAQCYEKGVGKGKNIKRALHFYKCAAKLGLIDAMHTYGVMMLFGSYNNTCEGKHNQKTGYFYLNFAVKKATSAYPYPLYDLGRCYEENIACDIVYPDMSYAFKLYCKGASMNCPNCQFRIGKCFEDGDLGQEKNITRAVEWYMRASDFGQSDAQFSLSMLFLNGVKNILEKNYEVAFRFCQKAAIREHTAAAYLICEYYERGIGVKKNIQMASWWSKIAKEFRESQEEASCEISKISIFEGKTDDERSDSEYFVSTDLTIKTK